MERRHGGRRHARRSDSSLCADCRDGCRSVTPLPQLDAVDHAALNSGQAGSQVAINARVGQTILVRCLDAAYAYAEVTFPVDVVITAWDGRALGVPPFAKYNAAFKVPKGTPIRLSTARRFDAWIRPAAPITSSVKVDYFETRGGGREITANIPFTIRA